MTMTRQHFNLIADTLNSVRPSRENNPIEYDNWVITVEKFTVALSYTNDNFNVTRFHKACGINE